DPGEDGWACVLDLDFDEPGDADIASVLRRHVDVDGLARIRVVEPVRLGDPAGRCFRGRFVGQHVPCAGESRRIGSILLVTTFDEHHADVEGKGGDDQQGGQATREEDENLTTFAALRTQPPNC
ncbi:MAG TPA: hypothetical protein VGK63_07105, partial [Candidatus Limnocylindrales bacterium]